MKIDTSLYPIHEPRHHEANRALLESLGVDGKVPLAQARINAGLDRRAHGDAPLKTNDIRCAA